MAQLWRTTLEVLDSDGIPVQQRAFLSLAKLVGLLDDTALIAVPMGVMAAVYLEEFAPKNRWTDVIEVNINNLAAVPSIVYGLLGLALFINWLHVPRSSPLRQS